MTSDVAARVCDSRGCSCDSLQKSTVECRAEHAFNLPERGVVGTQQAKMSLAELEM